MFQVERIMKDNQLLSTRNTEEPTNNGRLSILTLIRDHKRKDLSKTSDLLPINHSTLYQDFHSTELLNAKVPQMSS